MPKCNNKTEASSAWMEHQILEHIKQALRVTLGWRVPREGVARKLSSVQFTLKSFQRHLERLMDMEEQGGYLGYVEESNPNMHLRVDRLIKDHQEFRQVVHALVPKVETIRGDNDLEFEQICREISYLLELVDEHDKEEIALLQEAYLVDDGGEG